MQCLECGYDLTGTTSNVCPECGSPFDGSATLRATTREARAEITEGLSQVRNIILIWVLTVFALIGLSFLVISPQTAGTTTTVATPAWLQILGGIVSIVFIVLFYKGWMRVMHVPPGADDEKGQQIRDTNGTLLKVYMFGSIATGVLTIVLGRVAIIAMVLGLVNMALGVVMIVSLVYQIWYMRWLAMKVPARTMADTLKGRMWQIPVLGTVGILLCGLGPLIALVLYYNGAVKLRNVIRDLEA